MKYKFYILSLLHKHASGVIEETDTHIIIQHLRHTQAFNPFTNTTEDIILIDEEYRPYTELKSDLSKVFNDVEITKNYWRMFEYFTGRKRKAINLNDTTN